MTYPTIMPAITLDFANSQQLDPRITFSRSSGATYINSAGLVVSAAEHEPRFDHDPVTGECLGLLIESERTNYNFYSNDFSNAHYNNISNNLTETNTTAPDGSNDAISFGEVVGQNQMGINPSVSTQTFTSSTASVYVKVFGSRRYFSIREVNTSNDWVRAVFDCTGEGSFKTVEGDVVTKTGFTPDIKNVGNGWYRCSLNVKYETDQRVGFYFNPSDSDTGGTKTNSGNGSPATTAKADSGFVLWGYQQEGANYPTSLIPTTSSEVTRAVDVAMITGTNFSSWFNPNEGTMFADVGPAAGLGDAVYLGNNNQRAMVTTPDRDDLNLQVTGSGSTVNIKHFNVIDAGKGIKFAYALKPGDYALSTKGLIKNSNYSTVFNLTQMAIGRNIAYGGTGRLNGCVARIAYYPTRLTDEQLQTLTS